MPSPQGLLPRCTPHHDSDPTERRRNVVSPPHPALPAVIPQRRAYPHARRSIPVKHDPIHPDVATPPDDRGDAAASLGDASGSAAANTRGRDSRVAQGGSSDADAAGATEAFLRHYVKYQKSLHAYICSGVSSLSDADEVFQEVSLILWRKWEQYDARSSFLNWALGIARLEVLSYYRRLNKTAVPLDDELLENLSADRSRMEEALAEQRSALRRCLRKLPEADRKLLQKCYLRKTTIKAVAERLGRPVNSVYKSLGRIRGQLYNCIKRQLSSASPSTQPQVGGPSEPEGLSARSAWLVNLWCCDALTPRELAQYRGLLRSDTLFARLHVEMTNLHAELCWMVKVATRDVPGPGPMGPLGGTPRLIAALREEINATPSKAFARADASASPRLAACEVTAGPMALPRTAPPAECRRSADRRQSTGRASLAGPDRWALLLAASLVAVVSVVMVVAHRGGDDATTPTSVGVTEPPATAAVSTITELSGVRWRGSVAGGMAEGTALGQERYELRSGRLGLLMHDGARLVLTGPASFSLTSANSLSLDDGRLVAQVSPSASGFRVDTPHGVVIDRGTSFGVRVDRGRDTTVEVLDGLVEVAPVAAIDASGDATRDSDIAPADVIRPEPLALQRVEPGQAARLGGGVVRVDRVDAVEATVFAREAMTFPLALEFDALPPLVMGSDAGWELLPPGVLRMRHDTDRRRDVRSVVGFEDCFTPGRPWTVEVRFRVVEAGIGPRGGSAGWLSLGCSTPGGADADAYYILYFRPTGIDAHAPSGAMVPLVESTELTAGFHALRIAQPIDGPARFWLDDRPIASPALSASAAWRLADMQRTDTGPTNRALLGDPGSTVAGGAIDLDYVRVHPDRALPPAGGEPTP